ncbi:protein TonB-like isoform X1 [Haliotis rufescens]|uniref:protein TonB-like isoform X1 n=1 Tax=Haliotis rufescens TaxID=6454 RepID=UPI00201EA3A6|nr:protein TonB-like isoform X1 [Haliotis rufescens]
MFQRLMVAIRDRVVDRPSSYSWTIAEVTLMRQKLQTHNRIIVFIFNTERVPTSPEHHFSPLPSPLPRPVPSPVPSPVQNPTHSPFPSTVPRPRITRSKKDVPSHGARSEETQKKKSGTESRAKSSKETLCAGSYVRLAVPTEKGRTIPFVAEVLTAGTGTTLDVSYLQQHASGYRYPDVADIKKIFISDIYHHTGDTKDSSAGQSMLFGVLEFLYI